MKHQIFILKSKAGHWMFEYHRDGACCQVGAGYEDQFEAMDDAAERLQHIEDLEFVLPVDDEMQRYIISAPRP